MAQRLWKFENPLPVKPKIADSGSFSAKVTSVFRPHSHFSCYLQGHSLTSGINSKKVSDRLIDFELGMGVVHEGENDWRDVGRPQVAMHRNYHLRLKVIKLHHISCYLRQGGYVILGVCLLVCLPL